MYSEHGPTYFSPQRTSRTLDHWLGLVGIHRIVEKCRMPWKTGRRLQIIPGELPRDTQFGGKWERKRLETVCRKVTIE